MSFEIPEPTAPKPKRPREGLGKRVRRYLPLLSEEESEDAKRKRLGALMRNHRDVYK